MQRNEFTFVEIKANQEKTRFFSSECINETFDINQ